MGALADLRKRNTRNQEALAAAKAGRAVSKSPEVAVNRRKVGSGVSEFMADVRAAAPAKPKIGLRAPVQVRPAPMIRRSTVADSMEAAKQLQAKRKAARLARQRKSMGVDLSGIGN